MARFQRTGRLEVQALGLAVLGDEHDATAKRIRGVYVSAGAVRRGPRPRCPCRNHIARSTVPSVPGPPGRRGRGSLLSAARGTREHGQGGAGRRGAGARRRHVVNERFSGKIVLMSLPAIRLIASR